MGAGRASTERDGFAALTVGWARAGTWSCGRRARSSPGTPWTATAASSRWRRRLSAAGPPRLRQGAGAGPGLLAPPCFVPAPAIPRRPHRRPGRVRVSAPAGSGWRASPGGRGVSQPTGGCRRGWGGGVELHSASGPPPPGPRQAKVAETKKDAPGPQSKLFWKGCAATFGVVLPASAVACINLEPSWVGGLRHLGPNGSLFSGGQTAPWAIECCSHQPRMPITTLRTCWGDPPHGPDEAPDTPGWATCLVTQPVETPSLGWPLPMHSPAHFQCPSLRFSPLHVHQSVLKLGGDHL